MSQENPYAGNPYAPSTAQEMPQQQSSGLRYASQNKRLLNFIIDNVLLRIVAIAAGIALGTVYITVLGGQIDESSEALLNLLGFGIGVVIVLLYYILFEAVFKTTIAKLITGCKVVREDGGTPSFLQILGRTFARLIPFEPLSFLFGDKTTGWHDSLSGTRVVNTR